MLSQVRSTGKRLLSRTPRAYRVGKVVFIRGKVRMDRLLFRRSHPSARYVHYSESRIAAFTDEGYHSQYGQDHFLWNEVFGRQGAGFYVDIGGNDPVTLSNSYFLEQQGWTGVAFDPLARAERLWGEHRSATFHRVAIADDVATRDFVEIKVREGWEHTLSGFSEFVRAEDKEMYGYDEYPVQTAPLAGYLPPDRPVDLLMIDVEGAEEVVLRGADLATVRPRYVMIENVSRLGGAEGVRAAVARHGYELVARIGAADDLFRRADVPAAR